MCAIAFMLLVIQMAAADEAEEGVNVLAELPLQELLAQRKHLGMDLEAEKPPKALHLRMGKPIRKSAGYKGLRTNLYRKTFFDEEYEDEKGWMHEKKEKKSHDILNTSLTALSYLAFGGYLICMIVHSLREKRRRFMMAYPTGTGMSNNPSPGVSQFVTRRPIRIRFPTVNQGGKKRRKRSQANPYAYYLSDSDNDDFSILNLD